MTAEELRNLYGRFEVSGGVFTDTRKPLENGMFFALSGPNFNGNKFAKMAIGLGASVAVIDDPEYVDGEEYLLVDDTLQALQSLAQYHRSQFEGPVLGITGSNGKTTTKELITAVLATRYNLVATIGNLNNHIGVPLTLLRISQKTEMAIIEMGANHLGEIALLSEIAQPTHGIITNIGKAHIEGFGSVEGIMKGKSELYNYLRKNKGVVFVNSNDKVLTELSAKFEERINYPNPEDFSVDTFQGAQPYVKYDSESGHMVTTHLIGEFNFANAAAASCIGKYFDVPVSSIDEAISNYIPELNRSQVIERGSNTIILDAYNANPDSMRAALEMIDSMEGKSKVLILGDMLELGKEAIREHSSLGKRIKQMKLSLTLFCGELVQHTANEIPGAKYFESKDNLADYLRHNPIKDSKILIKASRGIGLETIVDLI